MDPVEIIAGIVAKSGVTPPTLNRRPSDTTTRMSEATAARLIAAHSYEATAKAQRVLSQH